MKGGKLAEMISPATVVSLIISDIINDPLDMIASGPTVENLDDPHDAWNIIKHFQLQDQLPPRVCKILQENQKSSKEFPHEKVFNVLIGSNKLTLERAQMFASARGCESLIISRELSGDARTVGETLSQLVKNICLEDCSSTEEILKDLKIAENNLHHLQIKKFFTQSNKSLVFLFGGETTVHVKGNGKGGRNQELILSFARSITGETSSRILAKEISVELLSCGTDGIDGPTDAAGAYWTISDTLDEDEAEEYLENNDSYNFWRQHWPLNLVITGHTGTNVADIIICVISRKN